MIPHQFSIRQLSRLRGVDPHTIYKMLRAGTLQPVSWSRKPLMIARGEVERLLGRRIDEAEALKAFASAAKSYGEVYEERRR
jgi:predicted site-specific integrase-resolvase